MMNMPKMIMRPRFLILVLLLPALAMCGAPNQPANPPQPSLGTIEQIQLNPPPPMQSILLSGWRGNRDPCGVGPCPKGVVCPRLGPSNVLTDHLLPADLVLDDKVIPNIAFEEMIAPMPWLLLAPSQPIDSRHVQLRGHFGDPLYAHCPFAERVFVVEEVEWAYADQGVVVWPDDAGLLLHIPTPQINTWELWRDEALGYSVALPPGATATSLAPQGDIVGGAIISVPDALRSMRIEVRQGTLLSDSLDPTVLSPIMAEGEVDSYVQNWYKHHATSQSHVSLRGFRQFLDPKPHELEVQTWFEAGGRIYALGMGFALGPNADQASLLTYGVMVNSFAVSAPQTATPTSAIRQTVGAGPFLDEATAWAKANAHFHQRYPTEVQYTLIEAALLSEAVIRVLGDGGCEGIFGHYEGVWAFRMQEVEPPHQAARVLLADAITGRSICSTVLPPTQPRLPPSMQPSTP